VSPVLGPGYRASGLLLIYNARPHKEISITDATQKRTYDEGHALPPLRLLLPRGHRRLARTGTVDLHRLRSLLFGCHV